MATNGGDVTYELRGDDSKLESDLNQANKKVEKAAKKSADESVKIEEQKTKDIKKESDDVVKNSEEAAEDVADAWREAGEDAEKAMDIEVEEKTVDIDVDADTGKAETKIKSVSKDKNTDIDVNADVSDAEDAIKDLEDVGDDVGEQIGASLSGNIGTALKSALSGAAGSAIPLVGNIGELTSGLSGAQVAAIGAGAAVAGVGVLAVGTANDIKGAMNTFISETGKSREEAERYQGVMEDIYNNNYGESFEDIAGAMSQVTKQLGDMDDASLQNVTESAFALRDTFGYDIPESTRAAKAMMDNFGISGEEAMNMIAAGAQNGLDYSGELLDSISEYSVQFEKMGLDADDMFNIFEKGAESGAFNLDKVGDAVKEMSIRVIDGSDTTAEGFALLGLNADEMAAKFAAGGDSAKEAFNQTLDALAAMEDPIAQNTAGVDLMGTMWEDLGPEAVSALADIQEEAYATGEELNGIKDIKYDDLSNQFEGLKRSVETAIIPIGEALIPLLTTLMDSILPVVTELLAPLIELFAQLVTPIIELVGTALSPLISIIVQLISTAITPLISIIQSLLLPIFTGAFKSMGETATDILGSIQSIMENLISFIKNVFTGNWRGAWENVKGIFGGVFDGLIALFKAPINTIIGAWNSLSSSLGSIEIPDWVPIVGGKSWSLPTLTKLKVGMDYVPSDDFPALLHRGEAVLTAEENSRLRSLGGLDGIERLLSADRQGASPTVVLTAPDRELIDAILKLAKLANRPVAAYFNVDSRNLSKTIAEPMDEDIKELQKLKDMLNGVR